MRLILALWLAIAPASAQEPIIGSGVYASKSTAATYTGPGNVVSGASFWVGMRAYSAAVAATGTQKSVTIRNTGTSEQCDVLIATSGAQASTVSNCTGASSGNAVSTFCGTCAIVTWYDQTGNSRDVTQATAANQPIFTLSCVNGVPCLTTSSSSQTLASAGNFTPASGLVTFSGIGKRSAGASGSAIVRENGAGNRIGPAAAGNTWVLTGGSSGSVTATATDSALHAFNALENGASSAVNIDGTETTGTATGSTTAGLISAPVASVNTITVVEVGFWDNTAFSSGNRTSMCQNEQSYYGSGNFGAAC